MFLPYGIRCFPPIKRLNKTLDPLWNLLWHNTSSSTRPPIPVICYWPTVLLHQSTASILNLIPFRLAMAGLPEDQSKVWLLFIYLRPCSLLQLHGVHHYLLTHYMSSLPFITALSDYYTPVGSTSYNQSINFDFHSNYDNSQAQHNVLSRVNHNESNTSLSMVKHQITVNARGWNANLVNDNKTHM